MKQTEIGVIPEDWEVVNFNDEFNFLSTASYSRAEIQSQGEIGYIHYGDIHTKLNFHLDLNKYLSGFINPEQIKTYSNIEVGDLIMADASEDYLGVGKAVEIIGKNHDVKVISGLHTFLIRAKKENRFALGFKGYFQNNPLIKKQYDSLATGLKVYSLSKNSFKNVQIPLPPLAEQEAIANALSDADAWIEKLEQLIAKKRLIKQCAMQSLLSPKDDWEVKKLGEVVVNIVDNRGKTPPFSKSDTHELIETASISFVDKNLDYSKVTKFVSDYTYKTWFRDIPKKGDLLVSTVGEYSGATALFYINKGTIAQNLVAIRVENSLISSNYLLYWSKSNFYKLQLKKVMMHQAQPSLKVPWLLGFEMAFPSLSEQERIATILSDMDAEIEALEQQLGKARHIKQGMMQELLTGRTRLV